MAVHPLTLPILLASASAFGTVLWLTSHPLHVEHEVTPRLRRHDEPRRAEPPSAAASTRRARRGAERAPSAAPASPAAYELRRGLS